MKYKEVIYSERKRMSKDKQARITELLESFETDNILADSDRMSNLTSLAALMNFAEEKMHAFEGLELDSDSVSEYTNTKALYKMLASIYDNFIRLDNIRCQTINCLVKALRNTDVKLTEYVERYEY